MKFFISVIFVSLLIYGLHVDAMSVFQLSILFLFIFLNWLQSKINYQWGKYILTFAIFTLGLLFFFHMLGFHNIKCNSIQFSSNTVSEISYFNFDKILPSLILLYFYKDKFIVSFGLFKSTFQISLIFISFIISISLALHFVAFDFKVNESILLWAIRNFFAVALCEEMLFRGYLQKSLISMFSSFLSLRTSSLSGLILASILFSCLHYRSGYEMMALASFAGIFYGIVYIKTGHIFYSTLAHFTLNLTHFIFFSYPACCR